MRRDPLQGGTHAPLMNRRDARCLMPRRRTPALALALLAVTPLAACTRNEPAGAVARAGDNPVKAVKDYLVNAAVDQNGYQACVYLTEAEQRAAAARSGGPECRQGFDLATLRLGGRTIETVHQVERLAASASVRGDRARVRLSTNGDSAAFELVKATPAETSEFLAPDTEWRIAGGALRVVPPQQL
jgi:hypothetical protein